MQLSAQLLTRPVARPVEPCKYAVLNIKRYVNSFSDPCLSCLPRHPPSLPPVWSKITSTSNAVGCRRETARRSVLFVNVDSDSLWNCRHRPGQWRSTAAQLHETLHLERFAIGEMTLNDTQSHRKWRYPPNYRFVVAFISHSFFWTMPHVYRDDLQPWAVLQMWLRS